VRNLSLNFFLGLDEDMEDEEEGAEDKKPSKQSGKLSRTKKKKEKLQDAYKKSKSKPKQDRAPRFAAIQLLHDPQEFCEKLFSLLRGSKDNFETRLLIMDVISRVMATHKIILLNFYPFLQKYCQPSQKHIRFAHFLFFDIFH
jgi:protein SDA1